MRVAVAGRLPDNSYLTSTLAPTSSNFFLMVAASSLLTPSLTVFGAPSTRSLASFKPRLVTSRTALMTLILLPPTSVSTTANSVFSSAGAAAAAPPPPPATTVAGAAPAPPRAAPPRHNRGRRRRDAKRLFHLLDQVRRLKQRQPLDFFQDRIYL